MTIIEKMRELSEQQAPSFRKDTNFLKIEQFYKKAIEDGIAKKPEYNLPQIDTIGMVFQTHHRK